MVFFDHMFSWFFGTSLKPISIGLEVEKVEIMGNSFFNDLVCIYAGPGIARKPSNFIFL